MEYHCIQRCRLRGGHLSELEIIKLLQDALSQITQIFGQIIAITFAMVVAIYYFLNTAPLRLKIAAFFLYTVGMVMYFLLAVRQSVIGAAAAGLYEDTTDKSIGPILSAIREFGDSPAALMLNIALNLSALALWLGILYLLFFWKKPARDLES